MAGTHTHTLCRAHKLNFIHLKDICLGRQQLQDQPVVDDHVLALSSVNELPLIEHTILLLICPWTHMPSCNIHAALWRVGLHAAKASRNDFEDFVAETLLRFRAGLMNTHSNNWSTSPNNLK